MSDGNPAPAPDPISSGSTSAPFSSDERVYLFKETNTWRFEADDGNEMEWDAGKSAWVPVVRERSIQRGSRTESESSLTMMFSRVNRLRIQSQELTKRCAVHRHDSSFLPDPNQAPAAPVAKRLNKKRKEPEDFTSATSSTDPVNIKKVKTKPPKPPMERKSKNTAVYVSQLPLDATHEEIIERFRKFGVLEEDDDGEPKVKMYAKDDGTFSGEALVVYFKEESVTLAETMLDDAELRIGDVGTRMKVQKAEFGHKQGEAPAHAKADGEDGTPPARKTIDRKKATKRINNMKKCVYMRNTEHRAHGVH
jgi:HIV Tat-specific factor 1